MMSRVVYSFYYYYDDKKRTFFKRFAAVYNFYIELNRYDASEYNDFFEHMGF